MLPDMFTEGCFWGGFNSRTLDTQFLFHVRVFLLRLEICADFLPLGNDVSWRGRCDSNACVTDSKSVALPLGYDPMKKATNNVAFGVGASGRCQAWGKSLSGL